MKQYILLFFAALISLSGWGIWQYTSFHDGKMHLIFCNVGQGDGILIKTPKESLILVDSGPDDSVLQCISNHVPFWDKEINLAILSHPHADHLQGFLKVFKNYQVDGFITERLANTTYGYKTLISLIQKNKIPQQVVLQGDVISGGAFRLSFVGPSNLYLDKTSPHGLIAETGEFGSLETVVSYGKFSALLDGDSQAAEMHEALGSLASIGKIDVLQVPHHGSKSGLDAQVLSYIKPSLAVISVGVNKYGHPSLPTLALLKNSNTPFLRTDQKGDVEIVTDGERWEVR